MSDEHAGDEPAGPDHESDDHGADHGHDDHGHTEEPLGPIDIGKWSAGVGGVLVALFVAACFGFSTGWL